MPSYDKPDYWSLKAQKESYPARSVYKLMEMDKKFSLIPGGKNKNFSILDIGAAPGSWSLYVLRTLKGSGRLVSVDLASLSRQQDNGLFDADNFYFIQGDIYDSELRETVLSRGPYSLIISDAAPATSGMRSVDTLRSLDLAEGILDYAEQALSPGGNFLVKVFQGGDTAQLLQSMRKMFNKARSFKPEACRSESFETYYIGLNKK